MGNSKCKKDGSTVPMTTFTKNILKRCIYVENCNIAEFSAKTREIAEVTNKIIQDISLIAKGRQLPFLSLNVRGSNELPDSTRVFLKGLEVGYLEVDKDVRQEGQSHLIEFQLSAEYKQITFSNVSCDAKLVLDEKFLYTASVDLFLDCSMFNSYSFLRNMTLEEKKRFSKEKTLFFKEKKLPCYYAYDEDDELMYYSLAFSAHKENGDFDVDTYLLLWKEFLDMYYKDFVHEEESIEDQLSKHLYAGQLDMSDILMEFSNRPCGDYLLLLTNRRAKGKNATQINAIFGDGASHLKAWKVVPIVDYNLYKNLVQQRYIAVFKVVK